LPSHNETFGLYHRETLFAGAKIIGIVGFRGDLYVGITGDSHAFIGTPSTWALSQDG
jgi:hypothetical protein